jgi:hypothetical protein
LTIFYSIIGIRLHISLVSVHAAPQRRWRKAARKGGWQQNGGI